MILRAGLVVLGAAALAASALALAATRGDSSRDRPAGGAVGAGPPARATGIIAGRSLPAATCTDWNRAGAAERIGAVRGLTVSAAARTPGAPGPTLGRAEATELLDRVCAAPVARSFLLYEMYNRAASFRSAGSPR